MLNKVAAIIGTSVAIIFLVGLAFTLTKSRLIGFFDVLPVYIIMGSAIAMMLVELYTYYKEHKE